MPSPAPSVTVRLLTRPECIPDGNPPTFTLLPPELRPHGFPYLDSEWAWMVEHHAQPIALVVASFSHGLVTFWRILATSRARLVSGNWFLVAIPSILDTCRQRGCLGYVVMLEDSHDPCAKIARIIQRAGGTILPWSGSLGVGFFSR